MMLRVFLVAFDDTYVAMPGGLTRVAAERSGTIVSIQEGGGSKDTWLLADKAVRASVPARLPSGPVKLLRGAHDLPSRVADNLFWFGRYLERGEDTARLLRAALSRAGSMAGYGAAEELPVALGLLGRRFRLDLAPNEKARVAALTGSAFDASVTDSLRFTAEKVHRMASLARDRLSADTWRAVNRLLEVVSAVHPGPQLIFDDALNALNNLVLASESLSGLVMENMTRGLAWRFVDFGRRLERSIHVVELISGALAQEGGIGGAVLDVLLEVSDSSMTYRSRYLSAPQFAPVLDLLMADESNPRSLGFQLAALAAHCDQFAVNRRSDFLRPEQRLMLWCTGAVRTADPEVLCQPDEDSFLEVLRTKLWELSQVVTSEYFAHTEAGSSGSRAHGDPWL
jgi:uncharacterized alpha-E superfamily protein